VAVVRCEYIKRAVNLYQVDAGLRQVFEIEARRLKAVDRERVYRQIAKPRALAVAQRKRARAGETTIEPETVVGGDALHDQIVVQGEHP
jgi:hypothetical protein